MVPQVEEPERATDGQVGTEVLLTTHLGLEDVVAEELAERCASEGVGLGRVTLRPEGFAGRVRATVLAERTTALSLLEAMRSIHHALLPLAQWTFATPSAVLPGLLEHFASLRVPDLEARPRPSFRVSCRRLGQHPFGSQDVERAVGAVLQRRYGAPVSLEAWEVCVRVEVRGASVEVALQPWRRPRSLRHRHGYRQRTALKATVAYAMLRLGGGLDRPPERLLDPFCGSGTVMMEAGACWPETRLFGSDVSTRAAEGAAANLREAGLAERSLVRRLDVHQASSAWRRFAPFDRIVTNPPYGARLGRRIRFDRFYPRLLEELSPLLAPGGTLSLLTLRPGLLLQAAGAHGLHLEHRRRIEMEPLTPTLLVFRRAA